MREDAVGVTEIADRLGYAVRTIHSWRRRPYLMFPEPAGRIGGRPYWIWKEVEKWAIRNHRSKRGLGSQPR